MQHEHERIMAYISSSTVPANPHPKFTEGFDYAIALLRAAINAWKSDDEAQQKAALRQRVGDIWKGAHGGCSRGDDHRCLRYFHYALRATFLHDHPTAPVHRWQSIDTATEALWRLGVRA